RHEIVSTGTAVIVEGYTDCIMAHQFGCCNVVATLGTSFTAGHGRMLRRYAKKVILVFDSDVAGIEAANRALDVCLSQRLDIKLASVPEGKDPCDYLLTAGKEGFERLLENAADVFQFKWDRLKDKFSNDDTLAGKRAAIEEYLETIAVGLQAGRMSVIDFGLRVNQVSKIVGLESRQINAELNRRIRRAEKAGSYGGASEESMRVDYGQGVFAAAQREVLEVLLNEPGLFRKVGGKITPETFDVPVLRRIAAVVFETLNADADVQPREVLARVESVELGKCVAELMQAGQEKGNFELRLAGALRAIERHEARRRDGGIRTAGDQKKYLEQRYEEAGKENRHNVGMV
ncbi:MAG: toprim domain-containing protein, partial [Planctomycetota bacterium]